MHHSAHSTEYRLSQEINKANFNNPPLNPNMIKKKNKKKRLGIHSQMSANRQKEKK